MVCDVLTNNTHDYEDENNLFLKYDAVYVYQEISYKVKVTIVLTAPPIDCQLA